VTPSAPHPSAIVLGIGGCSGSGKTTLAEALAHTLGGIPFPLDNYYRDLSHVPPAERAATNFDDPATIESSLLAAHVSALARGEAIERPLYDFSQHIRIPERTETIAHAPFLIVEGIFALCYAELLPLYRLRIFVDTPDNTCFARRLERDISARGRTEESVRLQYENTVRPAATRWVRPSAGSADLVVDGTGNLDWSVERVVSELRRRSLHP
jgi:uridine kinase